MSEKRDDLGDHVSRLLDEGDGLLNDDELEESLSRFQAAWELLPEPREDHPVALNILAAIAEAHFFQKDFDTARAVLMKSTTCSHGEPVANAYIRLRLGQCLFELGEIQEAANWLTPAYLLEGEALFAQDDPKYLEFIKSQLLPPPGGWPEGW